MLAICHLIFYKLNKSQLKKQPLVIMKKTIFLFAIIFSLFSCSKDDETTKNEPTLSGTVTYTINGQSYTSNTFSAALLGGKFAGATDEGTQGRSFDVKIGDSENIELTANNQQPITVLFYPNGVNYGRARSNSGVKLTIISWDGTTLKGSFSGNVYKNGNYTNGPVSVSGSFETNSIFRY